MPMSIIVKQPPGPSLPDSASSRPLLLQLSFVNPHLGGRQAIHSPWQAWTPSHPFHGQQLNSLHDTYVPIYLHRGRKK